MENNNEKQMMYSSNDDGSKIVIDGENNIHSPSQFSRFGANIIPHQNDQKRPTTATRFKYSSHARVILPQGIENIWTGDVTIGNRKIEINQKSVRFINSTTVHGYKRTT